MKFTLWAVSAVLGLLSIVFICMNYALWFHGLKWKPGDPHISGLPVIGGLFGFFALRFTQFAARPDPGWEAYALVPFLLDPGCYLVLIFLTPLEMVLRRILKRNEA